MNKKDDDIAHRHRYQTPKTAVFQYNLVIRHGQVFFTHEKSTFSTGFAAARDRRGHTGTELMFSLKIY